MNILYSGDANISDGLIISLLSVAKHSNEALNVYILTVDAEINGRHYFPVSGEVANALDKYLKQKNRLSSVKLINITDLFLKELPTANLSTRFTPCCMLRLFADLLPDIPSRILYLDNDVICRQRITQLYCTDLTSIEFAAVPDYYGKWFFRRNILKKDYVNSGVLLLNMDEIRKSRLFENCRRLCREKEMFMPDQSALNKTATAKKLLPNKFNEQRRLHNDTVLQHFTTSFRLFPFFHTVSVKPWNIDGMHNTLKLHEYDELLAEYTVFKEKIYEQ